MPRTYLKKLPNFDSADCKTNRFFQCLNNCKPEFFSYEKDYYVKFELGKTFL